MALQLHPGWRLGGLGGCSDGPSTRLPPAGGTGGVWGGPGLSYSASIACFNAPDEMSGSHEAWRCYQISTGGLSDYSDLLDLFTRVRRPQGT